MTTLLGYFRIILSFSCPFDAPTSGILFQPCSSLLLAIAALQRFFFSLSFPSEFRSFRFRVVRGHPNGESAGQELGVNYHVWTPQKGEVSRRPTFEAVYVAAASPFIQGRCSTYEFVRSERFPFKNESTSGGLFPLQRSARFALSLIAPSADFSLSKRGCLLSDFPKETDATMQSFRKGNFESSFAIQIRPNPCHKDAIILVSFL